MLLDVCIELLQIAVKVSQLARASLQIACPWSHLCRVPCLEAIWRQKHFIDIMSIVLADSAACHFILFICIICVSILIKALIQHPNQLFG